MGVFGAKKKWKIPQQLNGTFHFPHNFCRIKFLSAALCYFLFFFFAVFFFAFFFFAIVCYLHMAQKTSLFNNAIKLTGITDRVVKEANKCSYNFYRPNN